ncbi:MAG: hypothetical protein J2P25_23930 [Nocardiopsaceae bacterium]|nr:hypothetical protein [Nocardiopsaceae bacterium]
MSDLWIELNIALLPSPEVARNLVAASGEFARKYPAVVRLGEANRRLTMAPHLTLYQVPVPLARMARLHDGLERIARAGRPAELKYQGLAYNAGEASLEVQTVVTDELENLQRSVIELANPMRGGRLLERDPAGNRLADVGGGTIVGTNIASTGYAEIGELFRPHYTLNWFEPGTIIHERDMVADSAALTGCYTALGMFALGPYGTCPQLLARYEFGG